MKLVSSPDKDAFRFFRTIHGICFREIGLAKQQVMQTDDYLRLGDEIGLPFSTNFSDDIDEDGLPIGFNSSGGNALLAVRQLAAAKCVYVSEIPRSWPDWVDRGKMKSVMQAYEKFKLANSKFDFVDMLQMYASEGEPIDADVIIVDEAQDLSKLQWQIVEKFAQGSKRVYLGGDDDQSIYGFIGADPVGFLQHKSDHDIILPRTYRLKQNIFDLSQKIIRQVAQRQPKHVAVDGEGGDVEYWNIPTAYLRFESEGTTMVVARHHKQLNDIAGSLRERGVAFSHGGHTIVGTARARAIYNHRLLEQGGTVPVKAAVSLLSLTASDRVKALRTSARDNPDLHIDAKSLQKEFHLDVSAGWKRNLVKTDWDRKKNEQLEAIVQQKGYDALIEPPKIDLTTYHACKGREADHVVLFTDCYISAYRSDDVNPDEGRRLAYVGVTRARNKLTIVAPETDTYMRALL